jgi:hypothetical protein
VTTPTTDAEVLALVQAQARTRQVITDQAIAGVAAEVRAFAEWNDHKAITGLAGRLARIVGPRQRIMAGVTDSYLARVLTVLRGKPVTAAGAIHTAELRGRPLESVYGRLADYNRWRVHEGDSPAEALAKTVTRAEVMADTDVTLADVRQAAKTLETRGQSARIDGFRRVIHPERSTTGTCGLCIVASDRIYKVRELMPIHARCRCEALPIVNGVDPGKNLNRDDFAMIYKAAGATTSRKLKEARFTVNHHGELGPVLTRTGDSFRGPDDVPDLEAPTSPAPANAGAVT